MILQQPFGITPVLSAMPAWFATGTVDSGNGAVTPGLPTGHVINDILIMLVQSANETISTPTNATSGTWAEVVAQTGSGTAATAGSVRLGVFWMRDPGTTIGTVTVADTGNHTVARIVGYRGCVSTGNPWNQAAAMAAVATSTVNGHANSVVTPDITTTVGNCLILMCFADSIDNADTAHVVFDTLGSGNLALPTITERIDNGIATGTGGGIGLAEGGKAVAGSIVVSANQPGPTYVSSANTIGTTIALTSN